MFIKEMHLQLGAMQFPLSGQFDLDIEPALNQSPENSMSLNYG